ncbi:MAG: hypothetical protein RLZZ383_2502 [Pseudomonadota bacterium]|jgi:pantoate--beta-alanine ligase
MLLLEDAASMMAAADGWRGDRLRIGLVPTMGFLHRGHASLIEAIRPIVDRLVVSIYVNPLQFGANEDLDRYPRDLPGDLATCAAAGADAVFAPASLYPDGFVTRVRVDRLTETLCGAARPGHFEGVTTVVARLFGLTRCDVAIFGEKDWQQLVVLQAMARDLAMPIDVRAGRLVRDDDGVALSSRNKYLSPSARVRARSISRALHAAAADVAEGETDVERLRAAVLSRLDVDRIDDLAVVDGSTLVPLAAVVPGARMLISAFVDGTRLLDNIALEPRR